MSNVSSTHTVVPFVSGKTNALTGQRLIKVGYKETTDKVTKVVTLALYPSIAVSVPMLDDALILERAEDFLPYFKGLIEDTQQKIVRSLYEAGEGKLSLVTDSDISLNAVIAFLETEALGGKMTKESIQEWFDSQVYDNVFVFVAEKLKFDEPNTEQTKVIAQHVKGYRDVLSMLAGGKTILTSAQIKGCKHAISLCSDAGEIGKRLIARLVAMETPKKVQVVQLLGFTDEEMDSVA